MIKEVILRARYSETDAQGIVNNASYLSYFEVGRVEWLRSAGVSYREIERSGYGFVVVEAHVNYRRPAFFDDELTLRTGLSEVGRASMRFDYTLLRDGETLVTGYTRHGCIDLTTGRPVRVPKEIARLAALREDGAGARRRRERSGGSKG
ncbi:acyl-CoA thioesterase [Rubrobacter calidifluminis]|uniref:acyl-CoA thioesterase n=1 Tax=Rubrobacter calidifluminis TaxID=1392640 RepID=UPI0023623D42|nr:thioesterase family protein [Rubrobacter calidifluminis]